MAPIFDSGALCVIWFLALFCSSGRSLRRGSVLPHLFVFPTHRLPFCVFFPLPALPHSRSDVLWRHSAHAPRARACGSLRLVRWWRSLLGILQYFTYYCSDNAHSALETGRPATSGNALLTTDEQRDVRSAGVPDWKTARRGNTEHTLTATAGPSPCDPYRHAHYNAAVPTGRISFAS